MQGVGRVNHGKIPLGTLDPKMREETWKVKLVEEVSVRIFLPQYGKEEIWKR